MNKLPEEAVGLPDRWTLIRDVAVLQVKLVVDGLRDLILVPLSLVAGIVSLVSGEQGVPGTHFYRLLVVGKQSEHWINLFGALANAPPDLEQPTPFPDTDMDEIVGRIEAFVVSEEKRGGMTAQARQRFERALDALQRKR
jgi:hypothetical protein